MMAKKTTFSAPPTPPPPRYLPLSMTENPAWFQYHGIRHYDPATYDRPPTPDDYELDGEEVRKQYASDFAAYWKRIRLENAAFTRPWVHYLEIGVGFGFVGLGVWLLPIVGVIAVLAFMVGASGLLIALATD